MEATVRTGVVQILEDWLESECEQERPERISLLDPTLRRYVDIAAEEFGRSAIAPQCPGIKLGEMLLALIQETLAINCVESIGIW